MHGYVLGADTFDRVGTLQWGDGTDSTKYSVPSNASLGWTFHQLSHQPKLFLAYLEKFEKVKAFYAYPPTIQAVRRAAKKLDYPEERRAEVAAILSKQNENLGTGTEAISNLERLAKAAKVAKTAKPSPPAAADRSGA